MPFGNFYMYFHEIFDAFQNSYHSLCLEASRVPSEEHDKENLWESKNQDCDDNHFKNVLRHITIIHSIRSPLFRLFILNIYWYIATAQVPCFWAVGALGGGQ